jgi:hypothetical protein
MTSTILVTILELDICESLKKRIGVEETQALVASSITRM